MELKNAVGVCLISFASAVLVVLIAKSLDNQAASRLEPQLAQIAEELRAIRAQGAVTAAQDAEESQTPRDRLVVYYFHGNIRCPTCEAIETQTHEVVENDFAKELQNGELSWKIQNYEEAASADLATEFDIHMANVVLVRMSGEKRLNWCRLDKVWALVGDKPAFAEFVRGEIREMLGKEVAPTETVEVPDLLELPAMEFTPPPLPQLEVPADLPLPE